VAITNWQVGADGVWKAQLPEVKTGEWHIRADWTRLNDVEVLAFHSWSMSCLPIEAMDAEKKIVSFHGTSPSQDW